MIVQNQDGFSPISAGVLDRVQGVEGVEDVASFRFAQGIAKGDGESTTAVNGVDPAEIGSVLELKWEQGDAQTLAGLRDDQARRRHRLGDVARPRGRLDGRRSRPRPASRSPTRSRASSRTRRA